MPTDKTSGLSYETKESYKLAAEEHIKNDEIVLDKTRKNIESTFNGIGKGLLRFLMVGESRKHDDRMVEAVTTHNTTVPTMSMTGKDHEEILDPAKGPKRRPLVAANEGPNVRVSNMVAKVLNLAADMEESKTECKSTEELQAEIEILNTRLHKEAFSVDGDNDERCLVAGSLDFHNMYGSFKAKESAAIVRKRLETGPADINVNDLEQSRFLFLALNEDEIEAEGIAELLHTVKEGETKPKLTDQEMTGGEQFRTEPRTRLNPPGRNPTAQEKKKLTAIALGWLVKHIMTNFLYSFGGEDRRQEEGGPMGDDLTQAVSRHIGLEYDEKFLEIVKELKVKLELYKRYADDQNVMGRSIGRMTKFCQRTGTMISKTENEVEAEKNLREDEIFMEELRKIADTTIEMLKTEADSPARHPELGFKVPILDMAVWVEKMLLPAPGLVNENLHTKCQQEQECLPIGPKVAEFEQGLEGTTEDSSRPVYQVNYEFFSKPTAPKTTLHVTSVNPWQQKRTTFTQEVIRRLLRTRKYQKCTDKQKVLNEYMQVLKNSGYNSNFRREILKAGISGYQKILEDDRLGKKPLYRSKEWRSSARRMEKKNKKRNWLGAYNLVFLSSPPPTLS